MPNNETPETQFALLRQALASIDKKLDEFMELQRAQGVKMQDHEKRLTKLEVEADEQKEFRQSLAKVAWWAFGLLAAASVIAAMILLAQ